MGMEKLTPEEKVELDRLMNKVEAFPQKGGLGPQPESRDWGEAPKPNPSTVQRVLPAEAWVDKQIKTLELVGRENYLTGIRNPRKDPIKAGIAAQPKYEQKMKDPEVLARRAAGLKKTNMDEWTAMSEARGADNLVSGVTDRRYKVERFVGKWQPILANHLAEIDKLPDVTDADRENRMLENKRGLQKLKGAV